MPLTDADISKIDGGHPLTDADITAHDQAGTPKSTGETLTAIGSGFLQSVGHQAKGMFDTLSSLVDPHMAQKIGDAAIDAQIDQWHQAKAEYAKGNYGAALTRGLGAAVPFIGPLINNTANKLATGDPEKIGEGVGDVAAPILLIKAAEAAPEVAAAVREHVGNVVSAAKAAVTAPGVPAIATGVAQGAGAAGALIEGHPIVAGAAAVRALQNIKKGFAERSAAAAPVTAPVDPLLDQISQQFYNKKFQTLDPGQADAVQKVADAANGKVQPRAANSAPAPAAAAPSLAAGEAPPPVTPAPTLGRAAAPTTSRPNTILNDVDAYLAQRRAERAAAGGPPEAAPPGDTAPTPPPPAAPAAPAAAKPDTAPAAFTDTETTGLQIPRVANARAAIVNNMADYFHQGGMKAADLEARRSQPAAWELMWKNAAKVSGSKQGAAYTPSADTISATIERLETLEKAKAVANDLRSELEDQLVRSLNKVRGAREKVNVGDLMGKP